VNLFRFDRNAALTAAIQSDLVNAARDGSYSPYSNFRVGACLLGDDGETFIKGANVECASYGQSSVPQYVPLWTPCGARSRNPRSEDRCVPLRTSPEPIPS
jgi:hypothetical protein